MEETIEEFPSPIGELHFSIHYSNPSRDCVWVSVPYRGATFLNYDMTEGSMVLAMMYFRPLSGSYISQLASELHSDMSTLISVPYRGATFLNSIMQI